ncbi:MAG: PAS domain S-box protein [Gammaproteobacteria bacterium]|nr:PAS domain S-box protein [Gammaproteobacteria bacterium]
MNQLREFREVMDSASGQPYERSGVLPSSPNRLETLLQNLPGMAYRCLNRTHWPMDFVSDGCFELCGYHRSEIENQSVLWGDFTHPQDIREVDRKVRLATEQRQPFEVEYRIIAKDGTQKWVWERGRVVDIRHDGVAVLEGFITDITDRKLSEAAYIHANAFAQAVVDSVTEAVITIDNQGHIESFNQAAQGMFAFRSTEVIGDQCRILIRTSNYREFDQFFKHCRDQLDPGNPARPTSIGMETRGNKKTGEFFPVHLTIGPVQDKIETKYVLLIRDLTEQKAAEKEAADQRELLAHADRLNTLGETAGIAHEINQPLTAISMYANSGLSFLDRGPKDLSRAREALNKLSEQAHRAGAIIEHMQKMTRPRDSRHEITNCESLIRDVHKLAEVEAQSRNFVIVLDLPVKIPRVKCDPIQIQQVIFNLLRNGMEAMESCSSRQERRIILSVRVIKDGINKTMADRQISDKQTIEKQIKISIVDKGPGIPTDVGEQLYQPFATTKSSGMGLGLSISRSIISAHHGVLEYANNPSKGATFYFTLPCVSLDALVDQTGE